MILGVVVETKLSSRISSLELKLSSFSSAASEQIPWVKHFFNLSLNFSCLLEETFDFIGDFVLMVAAVVVVVDVDSNLRDDLVSTWFCDRSQPL